MYHVELTFAKIIAYVYGILRIRIRHGRIGTESAIRHLRIQSGPDCDVAILGEMEAPSDCGMIGSWTTRYCNAVISKSFKYRWRVIRILGYLYHSKWIMPIRINSAKQTLCIVYLNNSGVILNLSNDDKFIDYVDAT